MNQPRMGITSTSAGAGLLLAALLMSATLDCARKQGKQRILTQMCRSDLTLFDLIKMQNALFCYTYLDHSVGKIYNIYSIVL